MKEKMYNTDFNEQETNINIIYSKNMLTIYTCRKITYNKLKAKLGEPTKTYYINKYISGGKWNIPFSDKRKLTSILSRPLLIGNIQ